MGNDINSKQEIAANSSPGMLVDSIILNLQNLIGNLCTCRRVRPHKDFSLSEEGVKSCQDTHLAEARCQKIDIRHFGATIKRTQA